MDGMSNDRLSSVNGYDWSRSAPSTIPSVQGSAPPPVEDYGLTAEEELPAEAKLRNSMLSRKSSTGRRSSMGSVSGGRRSSMGSVGGGLRNSMGSVDAERRGSGDVPIPFPPPNNGPRRNDDMSTLTWDPGY